MLDLWILLLLLPDSDMHINKMNIDWNSKPRESKDEDLMLPISDAEDDLLKLGEVNQMPPPIRFENIIST